MSSKSRKRKAALRAERRFWRKHHERQLALYRAKRLPGETAREQLVRSLKALKEDPLSVVTIPGPTFKYISVGYNTP